MTWQYSGSVSRSRILCGRIGELTGFAQMFAKRFRYCTWKWLRTLAWTEANFCSDFIRWDRSIVRSRRGKDRWLFSTLLLARRPTSRLSRLPSSSIAALWICGSSALAITCPRWSDSAVSRHELSDVAPTQTRYHGCGGGW